MRRAKRGLAQLQGSERYELVTLGQTATDKGAYLTLRVIERATPELRVGAGYSSGRKGRGFIEFVHDRLEPLGGRVTLFGKYGEMDEELRATRRVDRILTAQLSPPNIIWVGSAKSSDATTPNMTPWVRSSLYSLAPTFGPDARCGDGGRNWSRVGLPRFPHRRSHVRYACQSIVVGLRTHVDTQDRYPFPMRGFLLRSQYLLVLKSTGDYNVNRLTAHGAAYYPVRRRWTAALRGDYGWNDRQLPLYGQYCFGGEHKLPGLHEGERFGNAVFLLQLEARYDLLSRLLATPIYPRFT